MALKFSKSNAGKALPDVGTPRGRGRWLQRERARLFTYEPFCRMCAARGVVTKATERDHIKPLYKGGADDSSNTQPLCGPCHEVKTAVDVGSKPKLTTGLDGWLADK